MRNNIMDKLNMALTSAKEIQTGSEIGREYLTNCINDLEKLIDDLTKKEYQDRVTVSCVGALLGLFQYRENCISDRLDEDAKHVEAKFDDDDDLLFEPDPSLEIMEDSLEVSIICLELINILHGAVKPDKSFEERYEELRVKLSAEDFELLSRVVEEKKKRHMDESNTEFYKVFRCTKAQAKTLCAVIGEIPEFIEMGYLEK